jgi:hypothetical protein
MRALLITFILCGCVNAPQVQTSTVTDLQNAVADAKASNDEVAVGCWQAWLNIAQVPVTGVAGTVQRLRDAITITGGPCAPIFAQALLVANSAMPAALLLAHPVPLP